MECRVLKNKGYEITQYYSSNHEALDLVAKGYKLDYITAHSSGKVIVSQDGYGNMKGSVGAKAYGNYVKIDHQNGYYTVYAHMSNGLPVKKNQTVQKGDVIGYMSDSGNAYGKHLHFEIWKNNKKINPTEYLNKDLVLSTTTVETKYKIGDVVEINGVYVSSESTKKLRPLVKKGTITNILENKRNPYLIDNGKVGWVNDDTIVSKSNDKYLSNKDYKGSSIVEALKQINIDSSYKYREKLAEINNIKNYKGTSSQNLKMLELLKKGALKY